MSEHIVNVDLKRKVAPYKGPGRSILFIILPYLEKKKDATKGKTRSFLAFPYGVLSIATYLNKKAGVLPNIKIVDLNIYTSDQYAPVLGELLEEMKPDVVGISMMFDQSYRHLSAIARQAKKVCPGTKVLIGGASATTAFNEILQDQPDLDAICYSEGEAAMLRLIDAENMDVVLSGDPW